MSRARGFTLVEVLVALAVLAVGLAALIQGAGDQSSGSFKLQTRSFARWVAANQLTELQLDTRWAATGKRDGVEKMARSEWHWQVDVEATPDPDIRRATVEVRADKSGPVLVRLQGFLGNPAIGGVQ